MRESAEAKANRYITQARLTVEYAVNDLHGWHVRATCRGDGAVYELGFEEASGWWCSCPALTRCSHLLALGLVVAPGRAKGRDA